MIYNLLIFLLEDNVKLCYTLNTYPLNMIKQKTKINMFIFFRAYIHIHFGLLEPKPKMKNQKRILMFTSVKHIIKHLIHTSIWKFNVNYVNFKKERI